jgi:hypothetical protein
MVLFLGSAFLMYVAMWALFFIPIVATFVLYDTIIALIKKFTSR